MEGILKEKLLAWPRSLKRLAVIINDSVLSIFAVWLSYYLRVGEFLPIWENTNEHFPFNACLLAIVLSIPTFMYFGLYRVIFRYADGSAILSVAKATVVFGILYSLCVIIIGVDGVPRTIGIIQPILMFLLVAVSRGIARFWLGELYREELVKNSLPKALIYGAGSAGRELATALNHNKDVNVIGFLDDNAKLQGSQIRGRPVYSPSKINSLNQKHQISKVMIAIPSASRKRREQIIKKLVGYSFTVHCIPSYSDLFEGRLMIDNIREVAVNDILGRESVMPDDNVMKTDVAGQVVMVTGSGGSIGSELSQQILELDAIQIILYDHSEFLLYEISRKLKNQNKLLNKRVQIIPILGSVTDKSRVSEVLKKYRPSTIYHAAAYKHVSLVENNPFEGIYNNCFGTLYIAEEAIKAEVKKFVLVSTDKAVRPTSIMGASKRLAEMVLQSLSTRSSKTLFAIVRFGNVLNSSGSVVPLFKQQIRDGGPVTVTHKDVTRYFMTLAEAASLVIQAGAMTRIKQSKRQVAPVYLLDMGKPIKIYDLATKMIEMSGLRVAIPQEGLDGDIEIKIIGLRRGEKLYEELLIDKNDVETSHPKIKMAKENYLPWSKLSRGLRELRSFEQRSEIIDIASSIQKLLPEFQYRNDNKD